MLFFFSKVRGNERPQRNTVPCVLIYDDIKHDATEFYVLQNISVVFSSEMCHLPTTSVELWMTLIHAQKTYVRLLVTVGTPRTPSSF